MSDQIPTVLVVDDSAFMRKLIAEMIEVDGTFKVIGSARRRMVLRHWQRSAR